MSKLAKHTIRVALYYVVMWVAILLLMSLFPSCTTTKYVPIETVRIDTLHHTAIRVDSIKQTDSIHIKEYMRGDTTYIDRTKYVYRDRVHNVTDTVMQTKIEEKQVPYPVEKKLSKWEQFKIDMGEVMIGVIAALAIAFVIWWIVLKKRKK